MRSSSFFIMQAITLNLWFITASYSRSTPVSPRIARKGCNIISDIRRGGSNQRQVIEPTSEIEFDSVIEASASGNHSRGENLVVIEFYSPWKYPQAITSSEVKQQTTLPYHFEYYQKH